MADVGYAAFGIQSQWMGPATSEDLGFDAITLRIVDEDEARIDRTLLPGVLVKLGRLSRDAVGVRVRRRAVLEPWGVARAHPAVRRKLGLVGVESVSRTAARRAAADALYSGWVYLAKKGKSTYDVVGMFFNAELAEVAEAYPEPTLT